MKSYQLRIQVALTRSQETIVPTSRTNQAHYTQPNETQAISESQQDLKVALQNRHTIASQQVHLGIKI